MTLDIDCADPDTRGYDATAVDDVDGHHDDETPDRTTTVATGGRWWLIFGLVVVCALATLGGWLGFRYSQSHTDQQERALFLQVARQGALNLTTINFTHVEADVQRILDSSTGAFQDDFRSRTQPFIDVVKKAQSVTEGSITEAGVESVQGDNAQVLVAVSVTTSNAGAAEQQPREWRMRIGVQKAGDGAKVSTVEFVP
jgi:Mce-associated membrane protein